MPLADTPPKDHLMPGSMQCNEGESLLSQIPAQSIGRSCCMDMSTHLPITCPPKYLQVKAMKRGRRAAKAARGVLEVDLEAVLVNL